MNTEKNGNLEWKTRADRVFMNTYARFPVTMVRGEGCHLFDADGVRYLDFLSGIAVSSLGHCHPAVTRAIEKQARQLLHVSNLYYTTPQTELAELLVRHSFGDRVFFANSGAEANEAAIKLARRAGGEGRHEIIALEGSFHGRTLATIAATGQPRFREGFEPIPAGFVHAPFADLAAIEALVSPLSCAILCEPIQGESGVRPLPEDYLRGLRKLCDERGILLIFDEVQTGMGRTGSLFAYEHSGVTPDIMTLAKALGNGMPIGATIAREDIAAAFNPGSHASTFGGNPVAAAAAVVVLETLTAPGFLAEVQRKGLILARLLAGLAAKHSSLASGVRGRGLLQALVLTDKGRAVGAALVDDLFSHGILANFAGGAVLRFAPPLVVDDDQLALMAATLDAALSRVV